MGKSPRILTTALYQEVADRLREKIYSQELKPGDAIDEQALAKSYGISRTPMREALKVLHSERLVTLEPRRGCSVIKLTERDLDELFPLMAILEGRCAYEAASKAKPSDIKRFEAIHIKLEKAASAQDLDGYFKQNCVFHELVQDLADNNWLHRVSSDLRRFLMLTRGRQLKLPGRIEDSIKEHRCLMEAFKTKNPDLAEKCMYDHLMHQRVALSAYDSQET